MLPGPVTKRGDRGCVISVAISLSLVVLVGVILVLMVRNGQLKGGPATVAILFGFLLASTDMAPDIQDFLDSLTHTIADISL